MKHTRTHLSRKQERLLEDKLATMKSMIEVQQLPLIMVAKSLGKEMDFIVTRTHLENAYLALDWQGWPTRKAQAQRATRKRERDVPSVHVAPMSTQEIVNEVLDLLKDSIQECLDRRLPF